MPIIFDLPSQNENERDDLVALMSVLVPESFVTEYDRWVVTVRYGRKAKIEETLRTTVLTIGQDTTMPLDELAHLASHYAAVLRERVSTYTLHAAAVEQTGRAALIAGPPQSGKTAVLLELLRRDGFSMLSSNQTLVAGDPPHVRGGTTTITVRRYATHERESERGVSDPFELIPVHGQRILRAVAPIRAVYVVASWDGPLRVAYQNWMAVELFNALCAAVRQSTIFVRSGIATWPFDTLDATGARMQFAMAVTQAARQVTVGGRASEIATFIADDMQL